MTASEGEAGGLHFSSGAIPECDRIPFWQDFVTRNVLLADVEHLSDRPLEVDVKMLSWPCVKIGWFDVPTPMRCSRSRALVDKGADTLSFFIKKSGHWSICQRKQSATLQTGEAIAILDGIPFDKIVSDLTSNRIFIPRAALRPLVGDVDPLVMRVIAPQNESLRLLRYYIEGLPTDPALLTPDLRHVAGQHIVDLVALALGATRDGQELANSRGVRAARLRAVKDDILHNLSDPDLSVTAIAQRQRVTARYVHMLFELERVTFSEFVLARRLSIAHKMLRDPRHAGTLVSAIAYEVGFGDLSYFNRSFRRHYGASPSDVRNGRPEAIPASGLSGLEKPA